MSYTPEHLEKWNRVKTIFRENTIKIKYETWIKPMELYAVTSGEVIATHPSALALAQVMQRYRTMMDSEIKNVFGMQYDFKVLDPREVAAQPPQDNLPRLNDKYTFDNFVVGSTNHFAYAASLAVAEAPSEVYNPLFIYGDVGLGKTHLMNAIGNYIQTEDPSASVMLITAETFTNELIDSIVKKKGQAELRSRMRNVDVLMVDDIQFLAKTTAAQEEFFHTFNDLHNNGKQIIMSSDRPPKEIPTIEDRLRSRFEWGLTVDIKKPDFETRMAILRKKAEADYIDELIPYEALEYIASHFDRSVRELEGALTRVSAQAKLLGRDLTMDQVIEWLTPIASQRDSRKITPELIIDFVAKRYNIEPADILSKKRNQEITAPRQIAIYICREMTDLSTTNIGKAFGDRDHTTIMHSCEKIEKLTRDDFSFKKRVEELMDLIRNN